MLHCKTVWLYSKSCLHFQAFGRHIATDRLVSGAYKTEYGDQQDLEAVTAKVYKYMLNIVLETNIYFQLSSVTYHTKFIYHSLLIVLRICKEHYIIST